MLKLRNNILKISTSTLFFYIAWITGTGEILNYVPFADPLNEMGFFALSIMMAVGTLCTIEL
tara:strand:+ start:862 stop:1047 length:186 start_codon:yes stop_codon:yes gene_type:complete